MCSRRAARPHEAASVATKTDEATDTEDDIMRRSLKEIIGYSMGATDGEIGHVSDFLFDDHEWTVRYLVASTGTWLPGRDGA
jgi:hypothetical protein